MVSNLGSYERSTILWLLLGGFAFGIGWIIGLAQLWNSASWKWFDKLLGTLLLARRAGDRGVPVRARAR